MHTLYELKDMLCKELEEYGKKGELTAGSLDVVDKLTHTIKNLDKIIEKYDEEYSGAYEGNMGGSYGRGGSYAMGGSYARGRGASAKRDSMGRYASRSYARGRYSRDYSKNDDMVMELRELMNEAPDEKTRMEFEKFIEKIEMM